MFTERRKGDTKANERNHKKYVGQVCSYAEHGEQRVVQPFSGSATNMSSCILNNNHSKYPNMSRHKKSMDPLSYLDC